MPTFREHLKKSTRKVSTWPKWKRDALGTVPHTHKSGVVTWETNDCAVMRCPECGTENEAPWDDGDHDTAKCHGGCEEVFELDKSY